MKNVICPFCEQQVSRSIPDQFDACPECGFRSARVSAGNDSYLIIDNRLPDLMGTINALQARENASVIIIDRRIGHNPIAGAERRR